MKGSGSLNSLDMALQNTRQNLLSLFSDMVSDNIKLASSSAVKEMKAEERKFLNEHPYKIWKSETDGKWRTYLPDEERRDKRKLIKRTKKQDIVNVVVDYWKQQDDANKTIDSLFAEVMDMRLNLKVNKKSTIDRHRATYTKHFKQFGKKQIKTVTADEIEKFIYAQVEDGMTSKGWGRLRTVLDMILTHSRKRHLTQLRLNDILDDMEYKISTMLKQPEQGIKQKAYTMEESQKIVQYCKEHGRKLDIAIALLFFTGLRVGELCTIRNCDLSDMSISITQALEHHKEGGRVVYGVQGTKTDAGLRKVLIPESGRWVMQSLKLLNPFGEYVFEKDGKPITDASVRDKLKYICGKLGIPYRSPHKIRKTYATNLIDAGLTPKLIQRQMGHTDITTTQRYYYQDIHDDDAKQEALNSVVTFQKLAQ